ncbi:LLM class flavin-dependent oxidoreductase, partial [Klebsiella pneumoniae]|uniref:LLM class flavin-dependent oxidoreductase n=1 Tax=Klebsiella pneumoniae TaxID=573 RepID=UPI001431E64D
LGGWGGAARQRAEDLQRSAEIHPINHQGQFFSVPGIHLCEPSPQRTPVLYQAGASSRGKQFAAGHAECVFVAAPSKVLLKKTVADIRRRAAEAGRDPHSILIFNLQTVIVGDTDREAQAKWQEYKQYVSYEARWRCSRLDGDRFRPVSAGSGAEVSAHQRHSVGGGGLFDR